MDTLKFKKNALNRLLTYSVPLVFIPSVYLGFYPGKIVVIQSLCYYTLLLLFWISWKLIPKNEFDGRTIMKFYFIYAAITYIRGFFNIEYAADWIALGSSMMFTTFLLPYVMYLGTPDYCKKIFRSFILMGIPLCIVGAIWLSSDGQQNFSHNLVIMNVLILLLPEMNKKWRIIIILTAIFVPLYDLDRRSILVGYAVPTILLIMWSIIRIKKIRKIVVSTMFIIPVVFLVLGLSGTFNIFEYMEDYSDINISGSERGTMVDSRTGIYEDVFNDLSDKNIMLFGGGGNHKTYTSLVESTMGGGGDLWKYGRKGTESGMLNHFQFGGVWGAIAYSLLFIGASWKACFYSRNRFMRLLGIYIAFKYIYSFIEESVVPNGLTFWLFLCLGICYNTRFRSFSDIEVKQYVRQIFK